MRFFRVLTCALLTLGTQTLSASGLPVLHLDAPTLKAFEAYTAKFEQEILKPYTVSGRINMDNSSCCQRNAAFRSGKPILEARENDDVASGSIHHFAGMTHLDHATIDDIRRIMEDYPNYSRYFKPDITKGTAALQPDSTAADNHFISHLSIAESTLWFNVGFACTYDTHYRRLDETHWLSKSTTSEVRELRDAKDASKGFFPEGEDHGFVWRTNTYWFVRQAGTGLDIEVHSITLSRPNITGFGWFGIKRSRDAVEKMMRDTKTAVNAFH